VVGASRFEAIKISALVDELRVDVLVDARHAENMPAVVYVKEDLPIEILVILAIAVITAYDF
jgi:hypothetical protein